MPLHSLDGVAPQVPADGTYWVAPTATVIGNVALSDGVGVWFGCVLRGDNEPITVGADTNIQEHTVIHTDPAFPVKIGIGCTIGHRAVIHGCVIGSNVLVGMGAIVLNGAVVGDDCLIGAGALVPEGREIPPGSLVIGMPGKVARPLTADEIARNRASAVHYVANWRRYAGGFGQ